MPKIAFVTDSTSYLTKEQADQNHVTVVPLSVIFSNQAYREGVDISATEFYEKMAGTKEFPTTSQPSAGEFVSAFEKLLVNHDVVLCLTLSSGLSGTYQAAQTAASMVSGKVIVVDSKIASYGVAGPLLDGVALANRGGTVEEILALWDAELAGMRSYFLVDTLEYLHRGGRIGGAAAVFGALLQIKPILSVIDGKIELYDKVRTYKRALDFILAKFDEDASTGKPIRLGVVHAARLDEATRLCDALAARYPNVEAEVSELGPVIGAHAGPGLIALLYYFRDEASVQS